jgi:hypothetical protein
VNGAGYPSSIAAFVTVDATSSCRWLAAKSWQRGQTRGIVCDVKTEATSHDGRLLPVDADAAREP